MDLPTIDDVVHILKARRAKLTAEIKHLEVGIERMDHAIEVLSGPRRGRSHAVRPAHGTPALIQVSAPAKKKRKKNKKHYTLSEEMRAAASARLKARWERIRAEKASASQERVQEIAGVANT